MERRRQKLIIGESPYWKDSQVHLGRQYKSHPVLAKDNSFQCKESGEKRAGHPDEAGQNCARHVCNAAAQLSRQMLLVHDA
jgi:hypothetical protein